MQPSGGDMPGMPPSMLNGSAPQVALHELHNGQRQQRQLAPGSALQDYDHSAAAAHDDFFDQMLSSLPWVDLNPANSKSPWDLASSNGGKPAMEEQAAGVEGLHYAAASYDDSVLLASRLRQHQISGPGGGGPPRLGKPAVPHQLNHASQQQHMLVAGMGRSAVESGLLPLPLSLGSGDSADSRLLLDRSRGDVDASFKTFASAVVGDGLFNRFGGAPQRASPPATGNQQSFHQPQVGAVASQNLGTTAGQGPAAGSAAGGSAPPRQRVRARRGQATDPHSIAERLRRERIAERMKALQELVPNANKTDKASMLDEIIDYVKFLQLQVKVLSMSRLGGAAAVVPLVADMTSEASAGRGSAAGQAAAGGDGLTATEHQVAKLMEDDIGTAMQYLQGKGLCLMPISLASAISATASHHRAGALPNGAGGNNNQNGNLLASHADAPSSPSMSVLTVQSAIANGGDASAKDAASVSKP